MLRLEFSSKFWEIERNGDSFTVRFGKIGSKGQVQTKKFESERRARDEADRLIGEKKKKGYAPVFTGTAPKKPTTVANDREIEEQIIAAPDREDGFLVYADFLQSKGDVRGELAALQGRLAKTKDKKLSKKLLWEHRAHFFGPLATYATTEMRSYGANPIEATWRHGWMDSLVVSAATGWTSTGPTGEVTIPTVHDAAELIRVLPKVASARFIRELVVACPVADSAFRFTESVKALSAVIPSFPLLERLTLGRFTYEDSELSWSSLGKLDALWPVLGKLQFLKLRAGEMKLGSIVMPSLKELFIETGGLSRQSLRSIISAKAPQLQTLNVWFGQEEYGCDCDASDVEPLINGSAFPKLRHLGLANTTWGDELAALLVKSKRVRQLESLDLSRSHLTVEGLRTLVAGKSAFARLQRLDVSECLLDKDGIKLAKTMAKDVNFDDQEALEEYQDEGYRYSAVGE